MIMCDWNPETGQPAHVDPESGERLGCPNEAALLCSPWIDGPRYLLCETCADLPRFMGFVQRDGCDAWPPEFKG